MSRQLLELLEDRYADDKVNARDLTDEQLDEVHISSCDQVVFKLTSRSQVMDRGALFRDGDARQTKPKAKKGNATKTGVGYEVCADVEDSGFLAGLS